MALWDKDLTTEDAALGAAQMGSFACMICAGFIGFYLLVVLGLTSSSPLPGDGVFGSAIVGVLAFQLLVYGTAAFRLRSGKGSIAGIVAAVLLGLETLGKAGSFAFIPLMFNLILLIVTINGVRGALALRRGIADPDEAAEVFR